MVPSEHGLPAISHGYILEVHVSECTLLNNVIFVSPPPNSYDFG
jgi:hypothetical protein